MLDIDGVLNSEQFANKLGVIWGGNQIDPEAVIRFNNITNATGAKIVITSTWRLYYQFQLLIELLINNGVTGQIIGKTINLDDDRVSEICDWIKNNYHHHNIETIIVLDDDDLDFSLINSNYFRRIYSINITFNI